MTLVHRTDWEYKEVTSEMSDEYWRKQGWTKKVHYSDYGVVHYIQRRVGPFWTDENGDKWVREGSKTEEPKRRER